MRFYRRHARIGVDAFLALLGYAQHDLGRASGNGDAHQPPLAGANAALVARPGEVQSPAAVRTLRRVSGLSRSRCNGLRLAGRQALLVDIQIAPAVGVKQDVLTVASPTCRPVEPVVEGQSLRRRQRLRSWATLPRRCSAGSAAAQSTGVCRPHSCPESRRETLPSSSSGGAALGSGRSWYRPSPPISWRSSQGDGLPHGNRRSGRPAPSKTPRPSRRTGSRGSGPCPGRSFRSRVAPFKAELSIRQPATIGRPGERLQETVAGSRRQHFARCTALKIHEPDPRVVMECNPRIVGQSTACQPCRRTSRRAPSTVERIQTPCAPFGPTAPLTSNLVPSWNHARVPHRKHVSSGGGNERVSPVAIRRTWMPVRSG